MAFLLVLTQVRAADMRCRGRLSNPRLARPARAKSTSQSRELVRDSARKESGSRFWGYWVYGVIRCVSPKFVSILFFIDIGQKGLRCDAMRLGIQFSLQHSARMPVYGACC